MAAVTYYATPNEVVSKAGILSAAVAAAIFPSFARAFTASRRMARDTFVSSIRWLLWAVFPVVLFIALFAKETLGLWLGKGYAQQAYQVTRWLAAGVLLNSLVQVPSALIQAAGKPDWIARLQAVEVPLYIAALYSASKTLGIVGVGIAGVIRFAAELVVLLFLSKSLLQDERLSLMRILLPLAAGLGLLLLGSYVDSLPLRALYFIPAVAAVQVYTYWLLRGSGGGEAGAQL